MLGRLLNNLPGRQSTHAAKQPPAFLNVGGGDRNIPVPPHFDGWRHDLLDIAAREGVNVVCDARRLDGLESHRYDAIYCSHNLEHYYRHDVARVLRGFVHVLKPEGFAEIRVPDIGALLRQIAARSSGNDADLDDTAYVGPAGPVSVHDILWGYGPELEKTGEHHYAHKCGFTRDSLVRVLSDAGFAQFYFLVPLGELELHVAAFRQAPTPAQLALLGIRS